MPPARIRCSSKNSILTFWHYKRAADSRAVLYWDRFRRVSCRFRGITGGALDSHEVVRGPIYLQSGEKGHVAYRNIIITPVK